MSITDNHRYFNSKAEEWDSIVFHQPDKIHFLLKKLDLAPNNLVLDVGTGTGVLIPYLLKHLGDASQLTAIDMAENMIERAKAKYGHFHLRFVVGDIHEAPFPSASFDSIVCYSVFPHFLKPEKTLQVLRSLLKPTGKILVCHSQGRDVINSRHHSIEKNLISLPLPPAGEVANLFTRAGLTVLDQADVAEYYYVLGHKVRAAE